MPSVVEINVTPRFCQCCDSLQDVKGVPAQSVKLPDHDGVSVANVIEESRKPWAVIPSARHGVGEGLRYSRSGEGRVLLL